VEFRFFEPHRETKIGFKDRSDTFEKSGVKLQCLTEERETTFGWSYREVGIIEDSRNQDSTVL